MTLGTVPAKAEQVTNDNIAIFVFQDGLIRECHDYFDPRRFQTVIDALSRIHHTD